MALELPILTTKELDQLASLVTGEARYVRVTAGALASLISASRELTVERDRREEALIALDALGWRLADDADQPGRVITSDGDIYDAVFVNGEWWSLDGSRVEALYWHATTTRDQ